MYQYFSLLYNKYRRPIIPIAVLTYKEGWERNEYTMAFPFFHVLTFHFMTLHLRKQNWRAFIHSNNPAAAALLSTMGYTEKERIQVKIEFLKMMARMTLDPARQRLIYGFFETYLKLTDEEEEKLMEEIKKLPEAEEILELPISYEEKGKAIGFKEGKLEGKREVALQLLRKGLSVDFVAEVTGLEKGEIQNLRNKL
jgi:predicted transposase/invertase (TIGR01784 family)